MCCLYKINVTCKGDNNVIGMFGIRSENIISLPVAINVFTELTKSQKDCTILRCTLMHVSLLI